MDVEPAPVVELGAPYRTDDRLAMQADARRFAADVVKPVADAYDPHKREMPRWLIEALGAQGYFGIMVDTEHGRLGCGVFEYAMVSEELARAWMSVASIIARAQGLGTEFDDAAKRDRLLRASARAANGSARRGSPNPVRVPTSPRSRPARSATARNS